MLYLSHLRRPNSTKGKGKAPQGPVTIDDDAVYLEDLDDSMPKSPAKSSKPNEPGSSSKKKPRFHDHDPYHLPEFDFEAAIAQAGRSTVPDPRIATEEEMREFIEDMRPEDFDVNDPEFRELSTELQYEIIGDLRLKSRQTSYKRLQNMLKNAPTPLDFSKEQIKNLQQRNKLTQQLLVTTDSMGKANIAIPIRIASERNREYVLMKNEGEAGGWILGLRDEGTQAKPIVLDNAHVKVNPTENAESDDDMEEVPMYVLLLISKLSSNVLLAQFMSLWTRICENTNAKWLFLHWLAASSGRLNLFPRQHRRHDPSLTWMKKMSCGVKRISKMTMKTKFPLRFRHPLNIKRRTNCNK